MARLLCDYIGEYFAEYFREGGELYLPIDWADYQWEGVSLQMRGQILNLEAERLAAAWPQVSDRQGEAVPLSGAAQGANEMGQALAARA